jgi:hypothetical protein
MHFNSTEMYGGEMTKDEREKFEKLKSSIEIFRPLRLKLKTTPVRHP